MQKTCKKCGQTKPLDDFYPSRSKRDGHDTLCKVCSRAGSKVQMQAMSERQLHQPPAESKQCRKCGEFKPGTEFKRDRTRSDGLHPYCRPCVTAYVRAYRHGKSEGWLATDSAASRGEVVYPDNRITAEGCLCTHCGMRQPLDHFSSDRCTSKGINSWCKDCSSSYLRTRRQVDRERVLELEREYRRRPEVKARLRAAHRLWRRKNPDKVAAGFARYHAFKRAAEGHFTTAEWAAMRDWFGNKCLCCGAAGFLAADHVIPLSKGGSDWISNIQPLCGVCNSHKRQQSTDYRDPDELAAFLAALLAA